MTLGFTVLLLPLIAAVLTILVSKKRAILSSYISTASALICLLISIKFIVSGTPANLGSFNWIQISELQIKWYLKYIKNHNNINNSIMINNIKLKLNNLSNAHDYHDLSVRAFDYCDDLARDLNLKAHNKWSFDYWFKTPQYDYWKN